MGFEINKIGFLQIIGTQETSVIENVIEDINLET